MLAKRIGVSFLDTGAMYRAVTLAAMQAGVDMSNEKELLGVLAANKFEFTVKEGETAVFINGKDFTEQIRDPKVTANAKYVASASAMREKLVEMQRQFAAKEKRIVTEGRDQGTVAFPDADIKFYLTADINERARRRQAELRAKGDKANLAQIRKAIEDRDESDRNRATGPMIPAKDGIVVDTTSLSIEGVVEKLFGYVEKRCLKK